MNFHRHWKTPKSTISGRLTEIENWISKHLKTKKPLLIIDDYDSELNLVNSEFVRHNQLVLCEPGVGLDASKLELATKKLSRQIDNDEGVTS